jgi:uncharacterized damage-inducible protein DinB
MTRRFAFLAAGLAVVSALAIAQTPAAAPTPNPISTSNSKMYTMLSGVVIAAAEKMPAENYAFKPTPEVRTFGQLVGHLADSQYYFCALASDDTKPASDVEKTKTSKEDLLAALKQAVAYCSKTYAGMTDSKGGETVKLMNTDFARLAVLSANTAHDYEHYGNMVTYMRIRGIVPPTSEKQSAPSEQK